MAGMYSHLAKGFSEAAQDDAMAVNRRRLNSCSQHFFDSPKKVNGVAAALLRCVMCDGWMPLEWADQYARGFMHANGDPEVVLPGFTR